MRIIKVTLKFTISFIYLFFSQDGRPQWEVEAKIIREKSQSVSIPFPAV